MVQSLKSLDNRVLVALRFASTGALLGWGILHLFWDAPYRTLLWNESLLKGLVMSLTSMSWSEYVTNPKTDWAIQSGTRLIGVLLALIAAISILVRKRAQTESGGGISKFLPIGTAVILAVSFLNFLGTGSRVGMFIESAAQVSSPILLWIAIRARATPEASMAEAERLLWFIKIVVGLTFVGHGLYAIGYYPVPGNFIDMTINILGVTESGAKNLLKIAGIIDLLIPIGFLSRRFSAAAFLYATCWGLLTTLARPVSYWLLEGEASNLSFYVAQTFIRFPHFALPFAGFILSRKIIRKIPEKPRQ